MIIQIIVSIVAVSYLAFALALMALKFWKVKNTPQTSGTAVLNYDPTTKLVTSSHISSSSQREIISKIRANRPTNITTLIKNFNDSRITKLFEDHLYKIRSREYISFSFTKLIYEPKYMWEMQKKTSKYLFHISFRKIQDVSDYIMEIRWERVSESKKQILKPYVLEDIKDIATLGQNKIIIAAHIDRISYEKVYKIIRHLSIPINADFKIHLHNFILFIIIKYDDPKKLERKYNQLREFIFHTQKKLTSFLYDGFVITKHLKFKKSKNLTDYLIYYVYKSISLNRPITLQKFNSQEFMNVSQFVLKYDQFFETIKSGEIKVKKIPVKNNSAKPRKYFDFIVPDVDQSNLLNMLILESKYNNYLLWNAIALKTLNLINKDSSIKSKVLIDVDCAWFIENYKKLNSDKVIYLINYISEIKLATIRTEFEQIIKKDFEFGVRFKSLDGISSTIFKIINAKFVIIDKKLAMDPLDPKNSIEIQTIEKVVNDESVKFIYENPDSLILNSNTSSYKIDYFYHL